MQRLSQDRTKSSIALREWGNAEGPDLGVSDCPRIEECSVAAGADWMLPPSQDVLGKVSILFDYLSTAERKYADHNEQFR